MIILGVIHLKGLPGSPSNKLNLEDEITSGSMLLNDGTVCNETVKQFLDKG